MTETTTTPTVVSIIPARGGSKGIERKNVVPFLGAPLLAHTVDQSLSSERVDHTYVSTDDDEIAAVGRQAGASIIDRPDELAGDYSPTEEALLHAVDELRQRGVDPDVVVLLQCTSPLRRRHDVDDAVTLVTEEGYDSALSACEDHSFFWRDDGEGVEPVNYDPADRPMRQEMDRRYRENGSIYVVRTEILEEAGCRLGGSVGVHTMPEQLSFEIDTPEDLELVEHLGRQVAFYSTHTAQRSEGGSKTATAVASDTPGKQGVSPDDESSGV